MEPNLHEEPDSHRRRPRSLIPHVTRSHPCPPCGLRVTKTLTPSTVRDRPSLRRTFPPVSRVGCLQSRTHTTGGRVKEYLDRLTHSRVWGLGEVDSSLRPRRKMVRNPFLNGRNTKSKEWTLSPYCCYGNNLLNYIRFTDLAADRVSLVSYLQSIIKSK